MFDDHVEEMMTGIFVFECGVLFIKIRNERQMASGGQSRSCHMKQNSKKNHGTSVRER